MNLASGYSAFLGCKLHNYIALYCKKCKTIYKGKGKGVYFYPQGSPKGRGKENTLFVKQQVAFEPGTFGLQSNA